MIVTFVSKDGDLLILPSKTFESAYLKACALDFDIYDWDVEEEGIDE